MPKGWMAQARRSGSPFAFGYRAADIYVFSHATLLGWYEGRALAERCAMFGMGRFD
ncbi:hypothetical protein ACTG15_01040 [Aeromonas sp. 164P]